MVRQVIAASGALIAFVAVPLAPSAAADNGQVIVTQGGQVRCLVSSNDIPQGGGPMVVCQLTNGQPWPQANFATQKYAERLNIAVKRGTGEFRYDLGSVPTSDGATDVEGSQSVQINGWTIQSVEGNTQFTNDASGHGMYVNPTTIRQF